MKILHIGGHIHHLLIIDVYHHIERYLAHHHSPPIALSDMAIAGSTASLEALVLKKCEQAIPLIEMIPIELLYTKDTDDYVDCIVSLSERATFYPYQQRQCHRCDRKKPTIVSRPPPWVVFYFNFSPTLHPLICAPGK